MKAPAEPFWGWPGWRHFGLALALSAGMTVYWVLVYGGADWITRLHRHRVRLHLDAELRVPFVPAAVLGYVSIYPLFWAAPFVLRRRRELIAFVLTLAVAVLAAAVCFLLLPADSFFPPPRDMGPWEDMVVLTKALALPHNFAPSLHVGLCVICVILYARRASPLGAALLWLWSGAVALSTILLHQHYLIDLVTGYALAWAAVRLVYDRRVGRVL